MAFLFHQIIPNFLLRFRSGPNLIIINRFTTESLKVAPHLALFMKKQMQNLHKIFIELMNLLLVHNFNLGEVEAGFVRSSSISPISSLCLFLEHILVEAFLVRQSGVWYTSRFYVTLRSWQKKKDIEAIACPLSVHFYQIQIG